MYIRIVWVGRTYLVRVIFFSRKFSVCRRNGTRNLLSFRRGTHILMLCCHVEITTLTEFYSSGSWECLDSLLSNAPLQRFLHECIEMFHTMNRSIRIHDTWSRQQTQGDSLQCHTGLSCACAVTGGGVLRITYINWCVLYRQPCIKPDVNKTDLTSSFNTFMRVFFHS